MRKRLRQVGRKSIGTPQIEGFNKKSIALKRTITQLFEFRHESDNIRMATYFRMISEQEDIVMVMGN